MVTWLHYLAKDYAEHQHLKGLDDRVLEDLTRRRVLAKQRPLRVESKKEVKKRLKRSPDDGDAFAIMLGMLRERYNLIPGQSDFFPSGVPAGGYTGRASGGIDLREVSRYNNMDLMIDRYAGSM